MNGLLTQAAVSVVLVHGGFVDGSGWQKVHSPAQERRLRRHGGPEPDTHARRRRRGDAPRHRGRLPARSSWSVIPTAAW